MAAARGLPIPPADQVPPELEYRLSPLRSVAEHEGQDPSSKFLGVPITSRSQSFNSETSSNHSPNVPTFSLPSPSSPMTSHSPDTPLFRTRAKTLASSTTSLKGNSNNDMTPRELQLPKDPFVNGQPIEAYLYKDASECPICFLYHPPHLNTTRCCDQAICSECFVQIKRPDPHQPEHEQPDPNAPPVSEEERVAQAEGQLVSEVATCPYCKTPEFGISYVPPPFRRGLTYQTAGNPYQVKSAMSSQTSVSSSGMSGSGRRRGTSLSVNAPEVITTDKIRPDWASKLATARAHQARRSAAATALHTAAYLMNGQQGDQRAFGPFGRRTMRRPTFEGLDGGSANVHMSALAMLAERHAARQQEQEGNGEGLQQNPFLPPPRGSSSRRSRMDDLEDMMMIEAIRLSLASEDERRRKEEKDAKKEAKKKDKEAKKAEKAAKKNGLYITNSASSYDGPAESVPMDRSAGSLASSTVSDDGASGIKGKSVDRGATSTPPIAISAAYNNADGRGMTPTGTSQESLSSTIPSGAPEPVRRSHLRHMSKASSSASSFIEADSVQAFAGASTPPGGGAGIEPMFNFQSLAAMIDNEEKDGNAVEHAEDSEQARSSGSMQNGPSVPNGDEITPAPKAEYDAPRGSGHLDSKIEELKESHASAVSAGAERQHPAY